MGTAETLEAMRIILSLAFLAVSSYCDYKSRSIPDIVFIVFMPAAAVLTLTGILISPNLQAQLVTFALYVTVTSAMFYAIGYTGLFGGADAKIMIGLSLAFPWPLTVVRPALWTEFPILSISIFNNALLSSIVTLPYAAASNIAWKTRTGLSLFGGLEKEPLAKRIGAALFCVKKERPKVKPYDLIAEKSGKLILFNKVQEEDLSAEELRSLPENVFVTFSLPMVIFITVGFVTTILVGDLVILLVKSLLRL